MTLQEKLDEMEAIWADLCRNDPDSLSPDWHREILEERESARSRGEITYEDLELARSKLLRKIEKERDR
jgi:hypothetical protein